MKGMNPIDLIKAVPFAESFVVESLGKLRALITDCNEHLNEDEEGVMIVIGLEGFQPNGNIQGCIMTVKKDDEGYRLKRKVKVLADHDTLDVSKFAKENMGWDV